MARPSDLETHLGYWLRFVSNHVSQSFARRVEARGVTVAEWVALRALYDHAGLAPSVLADRLGMTRGAISKLVDRLERKALLHRRADVDDGRAQKLDLTAQGRALVPRLARLADENDAAFFGHLAKRERAQLGALLRALVRHHDLKTTPID